MLKTLNVVRVVLRHIVKVKHIKNHINFVMKVMIKSEILFYNLKLMLNLCFHISITYPLEQVDNVGVPSYSDTFKT